MGYDYGKCEICHTHIQERRIKIDFWIRGELIVIDGIQAGVCPNAVKKLLTQKSAKILQNCSMMLNISQKSPG